MAKDPMLPADVGASGGNAEAAERAGDQIGTGKAPVFPADHQLTGGMPTEQAPSADDKKSPAPGRNEYWERWDKRGIRGGGLSGL